MDSKQTDLRWYEVMNCAIPSREDLIGHWDGMEVLPDLRPLGGLVQCTYSHFGSFIFYLPEVCA
jgi:hypothetical protein